MIQTKLIQTEGTGPLLLPNQTIKLLASLTIQPTSTIIFTTAHPQRAVLGHNEINPAIESSILTMKEGEKSTFTLTNEEIQSIVRSEEHKDKRVELVVEIVEVKDGVEGEKYWSRKQREQRVGELKGEGNDLIKAKDYPECIKKYLEAYQLIEFNTTEPGKQLKLSLLLNLSLAYMNNKQYQLSLEYSQRILREDPLHLKALYRKASSLRYLGEFDRATRVIKRVLDETPENKQFSGLLKQIREHQEANKKKEKQLYGKMFGN